MSFRPDVSTFHVDAFSIAWNFNYVYCFPPFSLLGRVLKKLCQDKVHRAVIICPLWSTQVWFSTMLSMLVDIPRTLRKSKALLHLPHKPDLVHPMHPKLQLLACLVSGELSSTKAFQARLPTCSWHHGLQAHKLSTARTSKGGTNFVFRDKLIPLAPL
jgi:hypothetical protein